MIEFELKKAIEALPLELQAEIQESCKDLCSEQLEQMQRLGELFSPASIAKAFACSPFIVRFCTSRNSFTQLLEQTRLDQPLSADDYASHATTAREAKDEPSFIREIRQLRKRELVRIAWRDLVGAATLDDSLRELSALADTCIITTLAWLTANLQQTHGTPVNAAGRPQGLVILAMGKLGANELNFSSDIDLIFAYEDDGFTTGSPRSIENSEFFQRLGQRVINALSAVTEDGFVYRVDMRLRPFGDSGPLVGSFAAMELYYTSHARDWERYAMVKARVAAGPTEAGARIANMLRPFVYRRYLDYGAFESIREMKGMINQELKRKGIQNNIKLGPGGIREIEFIGQTFQLIRGGRQTQLQDRRIMAVLKLLAILGHLEPETAEQLVAAYRFLRETEHRIQQLRDEQTHLLPSSIVDQARLAMAMGYADYDQFLTALATHRNFVQTQFEQLLSRGQSQAPEKPDVVTDDSVWPGMIDADATIRWLSVRGYSQSDANDIFQHLTKLASSARLRHLSRTEQERYDRLLPRLLSNLTAAPDPGVAFERIAPIVEAIAHRSVYLALLSENAGALEQMIKLCSASPWIAEYVARHPILLDEMIDPRILYRQLEKSELTALLARSVNEGQSVGLESDMEALRHFKHAQLLKVAAADISGLLEVPMVSTRLTAIAECTVVAALDFALRDLTSRHGEPQYRHDDRIQNAGFAIIAYGKLGGLELGYSSDLDLVFLHDSRGTDQVTSGTKCIDNTVFFTRLAQRIIHILGTLTPAGQAYEIDTRLRPSGGSGLLVSSIDAFATYQRQNAWTWEQQALVRARPIAGDSNVADEFRRIRAETLLRERNVEQLLEDVRDMRTRMHDELNRGGKDSFDLKQGNGGITDIEFMVQYAVLRHAQSHPQLLECTANCDLLDALAREGLLTGEQNAQLRAAYFAMRGRIHQLALQQQPAVVPVDEFVSERQNVASIWQAMMENEHCEENPA